MNKHSFPTHNRFKNNFFLFIKIILFTFIVSSTYAEILQGPAQLNHQNAYYNKYAEIVLKLNNGQESKIQVRGTIKTTQDGFNKYLELINAVLEKSLIEDGAKQAFNHVRFYLVNAGDYIDSMPDLSDRGDSLNAMFKNVARAVTSKKVVKNFDDKLDLDIAIVISEEYFCKLGLMTRFFTKQDKDHHVYRMGSVIHEIGHYLDFYYSLTDKIKSSPDYVNVYANYKDHHVAEIAPALIQAWFDSNNTYAYMPRTRAELKSKFPDYYNLLKGIFNESVSNTNQFCSNSSELDYLDSLSSNYQVSHQKDIYGIYPKNVIDDYGIQVPNYIQSKDSLYQLNFKYIIDNKTCSKKEFIDVSAVKSIYDCAGLCDANDKCKGFLFNTTNYNCGPLSNVDCTDQLPQGQNNHFQFTKTSLPTLSSNFNFNEIIFWLVIAVLLIFSVFYIIRVFKK